MGPWAGVGLVVSAGLRALFYFRAKYDFLTRGPIREYNRGMTKPIIPSPPSDIQIAIASSAYAFRTYTRRPGTNAKALACVGSIPFAVDAADASTQAKEQIADYYLDADFPMRVWFTVTDSDGMLVATGSVLVG